MNIQKIIEGTRYMCMEVESGGNKQIYECLCHSEGIYSDIFNKEQETIEVCVFSNEWLAKLVYQKGHKEAWEMCVLSMLETIILTGSGQMGPGH